ncbi:MAG: cbb3-type cytochrome c oxidase subunit II, partial [Planctomycetota bacterium]
MRRGWAPLVLLAAAALVPGAGHRRRAWAGDAGAEGRRVYVAEGCWQCHLGVEAGPPGPTGSRRAGPDLSRTRRLRSRGWQLAHLHDPRALDPGSTMASYRRLFVPHPNERRVRELIRRFDTSDGGRDQDGVVTRVEYGRGGGEDWPGVLDTLDAAVLPLPGPGP